VRQATARSHPSVISSSPPAVPPPSAARASTR